MPHLPKHEKLEKENRGRNLAENQGGYVTPHLPKTQCKEQSIHNCSRDYHCIIIYRRTSCFKTHLRRSGDFVVVALCCSQRDGGSNVSCSLRLQQHEPWPQT